MDFDRFRLRTPEEKANLEASWSRPDLDFFSAGACHILASVFLKRYPDSGFKPLLIQPVPGFRGGHVVAANVDTIFDAAGYSDREAFLDGYRKHFEAMFAGWAAEFIELDDDPAGPEFCKAHGHRLPEQYLHDPRPRALRYLRGFGHAVDEPALNNLRLSCTVEDWSHSGLSMKKEPVFAAPIRKARGLAAGAAVPC